MHAPHAAAANAVASPSPAAAAADSSLAAAAVAAAAAAAGQRDCLWMRTAFCGYCRRCSASTFPTSLLQVIPQTAAAAAAAVAAAAATAAAAEGIADAGVAVPVDCFL